MSSKAKLATKWMRFRAFLIDIFMIYVPLLYLCYFSLGKEVFLKNEWFIFACWISFGLIQTLFFVKNAQSPGCKAYDMYLISSINHKKVSFIQALLRFLVFIFTYSIIIGLIFPFLRKDGLGIHDLLSKSYLVVKAKDNG
ncbi:RDD family protein [Campylobacter sp. CCS1377]|uniref:RDD family protein n=1 Tax=Campylobacter sp. CCS1377 TaxID=3158229 RepID=A0AAU7E815_9BACT|nr:RDD family protein [Campylobacter jejuni]